MWCRAALRSREASSATSSSASSIESPRYSGNFCFSQRQQQHYQQQLPQCSSRLACYYIRERASGTIIPIVMMIMMRSTTGHRPPQATTATTTRTGLHTQGNPGEHQKGACGHETRQESPRGSEERRLPGVAQVHPRRS
mmetsp:Transcript_16719/g.33798  ORF Transcript_16719/g.33798 Transcript_16719/m.33798 type:complete len:139 (+) Transcript_16719:147-563(+)